MKELLKTKYNLFLNIIQINLYIRKRMTENNQVKSNLFFESGDSYFTWFKNRLLINYAQSLEKGFEVPTEDPRFDLTVLVILVPNAEDNLGQYMIESWLETSCPPELTCRFICGVLWYIPDKDLPVELVSLRDGSIVLRTEYNCFLRTWFSKYHLQNKLVIIL